MSTFNRQPEEARDSQPYDSLFKSLLEGYESQLLPHFCEGTKYIETLDVEVHRTTLRVDRVYKVWYKDEPHVLNLEFESSSNSKMDERLLEYHVYLHRKYKLPVISVIVYPFRTAMVTSPFRELSGEREILIFHFHVLPLWQLHAEQYVREHIVPIYALLPTMEGASAVLLSKAIDELIEGYAGNEERIAQELIWMGVLLRRASALPQEEKRMIEERLSIFDELFENDPKIRSMRAESEAKGRAEGIAEGIAEGKALGLQIALSTFVEGRYPPLAPLMQEKIKQITTPDALQMIFKAVTAAPDEQTVRMLIELLLIA